MNVSKSYSIVRRRLARTQLCVCIAGILVAGMTLNAGTFTVTNTGSSGAGSLAKAIDSANAVPGPHTINFNIPSSDPNFVDVDSGLPGGDAAKDVFVITLTSAPVLYASGGITVNGASQTAFGGNTNPFGPEISVNGNNAVGGLYLGNNNRLIDLNIRNCLGYGIIINGGFNNSVRGCYIGTDPTGKTAQPNTGPGIDCNGSSNIFGGPNAADRNVLSGNGNDGITVRGTAFNNIIQGNFLGTDATGTTALGNGADGIECHGPENQIIGNLLSGNAAAAGIRLAFTTVAGTVVRGNRIGSDVFGTSAIPNREGIDIVAAATGTIIGGTDFQAGNLIFGNTRAGIRITPNALGAAAPLDNLISGNSIYNNGMLAVSFSEVSTTPVPNDACDGDDGSNHLQNFPVLTSATEDTGAVRVQGTLNSVANQSYNIEFFANDACDGSGSGEGQYYMGSATVATDGSCVAPIDVTLFRTFTNTVYITATATDADNNTSEFSPCVTFTPGPVQCMLTPITASLLTNSVHKLTATVTVEGVAQQGDTVNFEVVSGPQTGQVGLGTTDANGKATFQYSGSATTGTDGIMASGNIGGTNFSCMASCDWVDSLVSTVDLFPVLTTPGFACATSGTTNTCTVGGALGFKKNGKSYISGNFKATIIRDGLLTTLNAKVKNLVVNLKGVPKHQIAIYLSSDNVLDPFDLFIKSATTKDIALLATNTKPWVIKGTVPGWFTVSGRYLILSVDSQNVVTESNEENNTVVLGPIP
jgi:hypothetical protein